MTENLLRHEASPYLLQHRDNPVHWRPWGPEALAEARASNKPILLSVGYAACHWCHVMAHESFENPATAAVMNRLFVNIKVDREERPDIDQIYMAALHALGEQGGWPLTMFLTPDGRAVLGRHLLPARGPLRPAGLRPGARGSGAHLSRRAGKDRDQPVAPHGSARRTPPPQRPPPDRARLSTRPPSVCSAHRPTSAAASEARRSSRRRPPRDAVARLARGRATRYARRGAGDAPQHRAGRHLRPSRRRLRPLCNVDDRWLVPHFEKMLYDNAQLVDLMTYAYLRTGSRAVPESESRRRSPGSAREMRRRRGRLRGEPRRRQRRPRGQASMSGRPTSRREASAMLGSRHQALLSVAEESRLMAADRSPGGPRVSGRRPTTRCSPTGTASRSPPSPSPGRRSSEPTGSPSRATPMPS